jgi:hypothetical protein
MTKKKRSSGAKKTASNDRRFCIRCGKPSNIELFVQAVRTGTKDSGDPEGGYGRFSLRVDCPWCGLCQKKTVKFGNKNFLNVTKLALESWDSFKLIDPEPSKKFRTLCWIKDVDL